MDMSSLPDYGRRAALRPEAQGEKVSRIAGQSGGPFSMTLRQNSGMPR
jgi:hypothetical protein